MSGFAPTWLAAREPVDARSRAATLVGSLRKRLVPHEALAAVDLGAGTGANFRYLAPRLGGLQHWQLVDDDPGLLAATGDLTRTWAESLGAAYTETENGFALAGKSFESRVRLVTMNLAADLAELVWPESALVTGSALLDLVSESWLRRVAARCRDSTATVLFALTYDGRMHFQPEDADDAHVRMLVNRHQRTDKGFGPALGPTAPDAAARIFTECGYQVVREPSDWRLGSDDQQLRAMLLDDWFKAATAMDEGDGSALALWHDGRSRALANPGTEFLVGHEDLLAWPAAV